MPRSKIVRRTSDELKEMRRRGESRTDWKRIRKMRDKDIVLDEDAPEITEEMLRKAVVVRRRKGSLTLRVDQDVLDWLRAQGRGYQTRINALLRAYMEEAKKAS
jgi:uncharacterized protein (DUF4415 family)